MDRVLLFLQMVSEYWSYTFLLPFSTSAHQVMMVCAQPQYRVTVDAPAFQVFGTIPEGIPRQTAIVILCFREAFSNNMDSSYCPLGVHQELLVNAVDAPPEELVLGEGADTISGVFPTFMIRGEIRFQGVGLLVTVRGDVNSDELDREIFDSYGGASALNGAPGTVITTSVTQVAEITFSAHFMVNCVTEFTGLDCTTPATEGSSTTAVSPTAAALPTTLAPATTAAPPTTEAPPTTAVSFTTATPPTTAPATDTQTMEEGIQTPNNGNGALMLGVGIGIGLVIAAVTAVLSVAITCCIFKRKRGLGKNDADDIETSRNPVYGTGQDNSMTNGNIIMSRNPVYGTRKDNSTTADYEYDYTS